MSDDDKVTGLVPVVVAAAAAAADPTGGVMAAIGSHILTSMSVDAAWRGGALDLWAEIVAEEGSERRQQYRATTDEFSRHRRILEWLQEELARVLGRIEQLEIVALGLLQQSQTLLRAHPDPAMRQYLLNAWTNALRRPDHFTSTWMQRLLPLLEKFGADHLALLIRLTSEPDTAGNPEGHRPFSSAGIYEWGVNFVAAYREIKRMDLVYDGHPKAMLDVRAVRLAELVRPPAQTEGADAQL